MKNSINLSKEQSRFVEQLQALDDRTEVKYHLDAVLEVLYCELAKRFAPERAGELDSRAKTVLDCYVAVCGSERPSHRTAESVREEMWRLYQEVRSGMHSQDFLGPIFAKLHLAGRDPWERLLAPTGAASYLHRKRVTQEDLEACERSKQTLWVLERSCGSGASVIDLVNHIRGINDIRGGRPRLEESCLMVTAIEGNPLLYKMAYLQLQLLAVPAIVILGDIKSGREVDRVWTETAAFHSLRSSGFMSMPLAEIAAGVGAK